MRFSNRRSLLCFGFVVGLVTSRLSKGSARELSLKRSERLKQERIELLLKSLENEGIKDLCHPTSREFEPLFPQCRDKRILLTADEGENLSSNSSETTEDDESEPRSETFLITNAILALVCVMIAALAAGLTMGLLSLDPLNLLIKIRAAPTEQEKQQAASLLPIVKQHHLLLVTLLLLNSMANEALPLFLDEIVPSYVAVILSVTLVLFFGEIIPSAIFTGPNKVKMASQLAPLVRIIMCLLFPLAFPIAKLLDVVLHDDDDGHGDTGSGAFDRGELAALVRIQYEERLAAKNRRRKELAGAMRRLKASSSDIVSSSVVSNSNQIIAPPANGPALRKAKMDLLRQDASLSAIPPFTRPIYARSPSIHYDEVNMVEGALAMKTKLAMDVYTPLRNVFAIPYDTILDEANIVNIYSSGYSRIPVYAAPKVSPDKKKKKPKQQQGINEKSAICGILMTKQLMVVDSIDKRPLSTLPLYRPNCVSPAMNLIDLLNLLQAGRKGIGGGHLALVCVRPGLAEEALELGEPIPQKAGFMGIVTLEDCLEELIQEQIYDETDMLEINRVRKAEWAWRRWRLFVKKRRIKREEEELRRQEQAALNDSQPAFLRILHEAQAAVRQQSGNNESTPLLMQDPLASSSQTMLFGFIPVLQQQQPPPPTLPEQEEQQQQEETTATGGVFV